LTQPVGYSRILELKKFPVPPSLVEIGEGYLGVVGPDLKE